MTSGPPNSNRHTDLREPASNPTSPVERLVFTSVPLWVVILLMMLALIGSLWLAGLGVEAERSPRAPKLPGSVAIWSSDRLNDFANLLESNPQRAWEQRFDGVTGLQRMDESFVDQGYLILSRHSSEHRHAVIELLNLATGAVEHRWTPDWPSIAAAASLGPNAWLPPDGANRPIDRRSASLPIPQADGSLWLLNMDGPVVRIDACGKVEQVISGFFHHSFEQNHDGNFWVPAVVPEEYPIGQGYRFRDDLLTLINPRGEVLHSQSVAELLLNNGYASLLKPLLGFGETDPIHLNDIQPALSDGPHWRKGDVAVSLRSLSTVFIYRPATGKIVWLQTGPWLNQHDVDFLPDGRLSVFGNDIIWGTDLMREKHNSVYIVDPASGETTQPYRAGMAEQNIRTRTAGLADVLDNGDVFIEETNYGRLLRLSTEGKVRWTYVNRDQNDEVSFVSWSRYVSADDMPKFTDKAFAKCAIGTEPGNASKSASKAGHAQLSRSLENPAAHP